MKRPSLLLLTANFPFGTGEEFLETEILAHCTKKCLTQSRRVAKEKRCKEKFSALASLCEISFFGSGLSGLEQYLNTPVSLFGQRAKLSVYEL